MKLQTHPPSDLSGLPFVAVPGGREADQAGRVTSTAIRLINSLVVAVQTSRRRRIVLLRQLLLRNCIERRDETKRVLVLLKSHSSAQH